MRGFVALLRRECRDARWHLVGSAALAVAVPFAVHGWMMDGASAEAMATTGGCWLVPILFALFAAATASDLVARDVATRRIDALAVLPVPGSLVWAAKFTLFLGASLGFLVWLIAAEWLAIETTRSTPGSGLFLAELLDAIPSLLGGLALGTASLFLDRKSVV